MIDKELKEKNIKDLEYNHLLNKQNITLILFGTAIISVILTDELPLNITKVDLLLFLFAAAVAILLYFGKKLEDKTNEIKNL